MIPTCVSLEELFIFEYAHDLMDDDFLFIRLKLELVNGQPFIDSSFCLGALVTPARKSSASSQISETMDLRSIADAMKLRTAKKPRPGTRKKLQGEVEHPFAQDFSVHHHFDLMLSRVMNASCEISDPLSFADGEGSARG